MANIGKSPRVFRLLLVSVTIKEFTENHKGSHIINKVYSKMNIGLPVSVPAFESNCLYDCWQNMSLSTVIVFHQENELFLSMILSHSSRFVILWIFYFFNEEIIIFLSLKNGRKALLALVAKMITVYTIGK